jgi:hypothetical protein
MSRNWANYEAGARIVDFSTELEGCSAKNVQLADQASIWLTAPVGMPQWICVSLADVRVVTTEALVLRTVGWECWHSYGTNPKTVKVHVSSDGIKFKVWDTLCAPMQRGTQLFTTSSININIYPYVAFEIVETHGGNQTYMNRIFLYTDEVPPSPAPRTAGRARYLGLFPRSPKMSLTPQKEEEDEENENKNIDGGSDIGAAAATGTSGSSALADSAVHIDTQLSIDAHAASNKAAFDSSANISVSVSAWAARVERLEEAHAKLLLLLSEQQKQGLSQSTSTARSSLKTAVKSSPFADKASIREPSAASGASAPLEEVRQALDRIEQQHAAFLLSFGSLAAQVRRGSSMGESPTSALGAAVDSNFLPPRPDLQALRREYGLCGKDSERVMSDEFNAFRAKQGAPLASSAVTGVTARRRKAKHPRQTVAPSERARRAPAANDAEAEVDSDVARLSLLLRVAQHRRAAKEAELRQLIEQSQGAASVGRTKMAAGSSDKAR